MNSPLQVGVHEGLEDPNLCLSAQVSTTPNTRVELVHYVVGQANPPCDSLSRPTIVMHYTTKVCEIFQDLNVLATRMDGLYCLIQHASKHLDLGSGNLKCQGLHLLVQCL